MLIGRKVAETANKEVWREWSGCQYAGRGQVFEVSMLLGSLCWSACVVGDLSCVAFSTYWCSWGTSNSPAAVAAIPPSLLSFPPFSCGVAVAGLI